MASSKDSVVRGLLSSHDRLTINCFFRLLYFNSWVMVNSVMILSGQRVRLSSNVIKNENVAGIPFNTASLSSLLNAPSTLRKSKRSSRLLETSISVSFASVAKENEGKNNTTHKSTAKILVSIGVFIRFFNSCGLREFF